MGITAGAAPEAHVSAAASSSASLTGAGFTTLPEDCAPKKLTCWYKFPWISHKGWMTGIYLERSKPRFRYACAGCLQHLQQQQISFERFPSPEEQNQIVEDAPTTVPEDPVPKKLTCGYKFPWISHEGWMTGIYVERGRRRFRYACAGCLQLLQQEQTLFELTPTSEEQNQIIEDA